MSILFINGSPNKNGNTVDIAKILLKDKKYETLNLVDYKIYSYGQNFEDDQFKEVIEKMLDVDIIVIGSPMYWHSMCGAVRNLLDRTYGELTENIFSDKKLYFIFQGAAQTKEQLNDGNYTMERYAILYGFKYKGMITDKSEAQKMNNNL